MYSTCLFCHTTLGTNEAVEHFPVGRRLAFDAAKGRLWVVCRKCERWNLTPVEERWEAIEECERSFRDTKLRVSTDQIGMARLSEGLELVRIGSPQRPEFAAWRYGDQFGRRRRKNLIRTGSVFVAIGAAQLTGPIVATALGAVGIGVAQLGALSHGIYRRTRVIARIRDNDGKLLNVREPDADATVMLPAERDREWGLRVSHRMVFAADSPWGWWNPMAGSTQTDIRGEDALRAAAQLLPRLNRTGATKAQIARAVTLATQDKDPSAGFERAARLAKRSWNNFGKGAMMKVLPVDVRLALEMTSHEESERRAMEGELYLLETAWREAEEIAAISDDMFLPTGVSESLAEIKDRVQKQTP
jgi:hypothetical protein